MDKVCAVVSRLADWASARPAVPVAFAEPDLPGPIKTSPQPLIEVLIVWSGQVHFCVGGTNPRHARRARLGPGSVAVFNAHFGNRDEPPAPGRGYRYGCISFAVGDEPRLAGLAGRPFLYWTQAAHPAGLLGQYREVSRWFCSPSRQLPAIQLKAAVLDFLVGVYAACRGTPGPDLSGSPVQRLIGLLHTRQSDPDLRVESLTRELHISHDHLGRLFRRQTGVSPMQYLSSLRLSRAAGLLSHTDLSVKQVAYTVGYRDPGYFCRAFRRHTGKAPSAFRPGIGREA